jgi:hypothetical protein
MSQRRQAAFLEYSMAAYITIFILFNCSDLLTPIIE